MTRGLLAAKGGLAVDKIMVLVVEDDPIIQLDLEHTLHDGGFATVGEVSGEAAIARLESEAGIRVVVTDINLQMQASGWDVARRARELFPDLPVLYVTSAAADEWTSQGVP